MSSYEKYKKLATELDLCAEALEAEGDMKTAALVDEAAEELRQFMEKKPVSAAPRRNVAKARAEAKAKAAAKAKGKTATKRTARKVYTASQLKVLKEAHAELYQCARDLFKEKDLVTAKAVLTAAEELEEEMSFSLPDDSIPEDPAADLNSDEQICLDEELAKELAEALGLQGFVDYTPEAAPETSLASTRRERLRKARKAAEARRSASAKKSAPKPRETPRSAREASNARALRLARARRLARLK